MFYVYMSQNLYLPFPDFFWNKVWLFLVNTPQVGYSDYNNTA